MEANSEVKLRNVSLKEGVCPSFPSRTHTSPAVWIVDMMAGFPSLILRTGTPLGMVIRKPTEACIPNDYGGPISATNCPWGIFYMTENQTSLWFKPLFLWVVAVHSSSQMLANSAIDYKS